ncbi:MAG TPA: POTRA domain-containing protein [Terriglobales bacterium]|nr:POTRA domain-containing protein [Terriglobales bacterium]
MRFRINALKLCAAAILSLAWCAAQTTANGAAAQVPARNALPPGSRAADPPRAAPPVPPPAGNPLSYFGLKVAAIEVRSNATVSADEVLRLPQKVNEPLDKNKLRRSIQQLFATGKFADIQVEADRTQKNEVALVFIAEENYFVGFMTMTGAPRPPTAEQLINATKLQLGELYTEEKLQAAIRGIQRVMADNGYYQSSADVRKEPHSDTQQIDLHFTVHPGKVARIGQIKVEGQAGYPPEQVAHIAKLKPGEKVSVDRLNKALQRLRKKYQKQGRLEAQVALVDRVYHPESNALDYAFSIHRGPKVEVRLEGARLSGRKLKKYVPVYEESAVDDDLLNEGRRNLRDYFQTKGYFDVQVDFSHKDDPASDRAFVIYTVNLGPQYDLDAVLFQGNNYFNDDVLRERIQVQPSGGLLAHGRFSETMLVRDKESIEAVYKANGFSKVQVQPMVQKDYRGKAGHLAVSFHVVEGPQQRVESLNIVGNRSIPVEELKALINTLPGQPYSEFTVAGDRDSVQNYYFNHGFLNVRVEATAQPDPKDPAQAAVTYTIHEGAQVFVDRVLFSGLHYTRPSTVGHQFELWNGDPLSQSRMLDTQRKLYDLGLFNQVNMAVQNPDGAAQRKNLLTQFDEARRWTITYGLGLEIQTGTGALPNCDTAIPACVAERQAAASGENTGVSPRVSLDITRTNFRGRDHSIVFKSNYGRLQKRASLAYEAPRFWDVDKLKFTGTIFYDNSRDVSTFASERLEGSLQVQQKLNRADYLLYRMTYRRVKVDPTTLVISPDQIPLLSQPVRVGIPSFSYIRDRRDDPIDTHKGYYNTFDFGVASGVFGSEANFSRLLVQNSSYWQLGRRKFVLARTTQIGFAEPFSGPVKDQNGNLVPPFIPLPERFFAGGGNTHRGFALNQAGPRDPGTGAPLGGGGLLLNSVELRLPPPTLPFLENNLSFVIFEDAGNVFNDPGDIPHSVFRLQQPNRSQCETLDPNANCSFNYLSHAVGLGVRYKTPIGPLRFDFGYNLNPPTFPERQGSLIKTLSHFNFYFSIGQSF